jgi:hypothetical protein
VRDEAAKSELRKQVGDIGLILSVNSTASIFNLPDAASSTLYESKGLEFDDVGDSSRNVGHALIKFPRFCYTSSSKIRPWISANGVSC